MQSELPCLRHSPKLQGMEEAGLEIRTLCSIVLTELLRQACGGEPAGSPANPLTIILTVKTSFFPHQGLWQSVLSHSTKDGGVSSLIWGMAEHLAPAKLFATFLPSFCQSSIALHSKCHELPEQHHSSFAVF